MPMENESCVSHMYVHAGWELELLSDDLGGK